MLLVSESGLCISVYAPVEFAYDKVNYARYLSPYFAEMTNLPEKKPDVFGAFKDGQFSVHFSSSIYTPLVGFLWIRPLRL